VHVQFGFGQCAVRISHSCHNRKLR
jgi:hypothetical protein